MKPVKNNRLYVQNIRVFDPFYTIPDSTTNLSLASVGPVSMDKTRSASPQNAHYTNGKRSLEVWLNYTVSLEDISSITENTV